MKFHAILLLALVLAATGCSANKTQRSPSLTAYPARPAPPQRNVFKEAGDTTWQVVTAPARLVAPKKVDRKEPETFEAPAAVIVRRSYVDDDDAPTPAAAPPAATSPKPNP